MSEAMKHNLTIIAEELGYGTSRNIIAALNCEFDATWCPLNVEDIDKMSTFKPSTIARLVLSNTRGTFDFCPTQHRSALEVAAPDMLAALEAGVAEADRQDPREFTEFSEQVQEQMSAAIAKATETLP